MLIVPVVLAAGASRRMGAPKLLLPFGGSSLLRRAVAAARSVGPTVVVSGAYPELTAAHLAELPPGDHGYRIVHNPGWDHGMAGSLRTGIAAARTAGAAGYLVLLADQPAVDARYLQPYLTAFAADPDRTVATAYPRRAGVPALFPAHRTEELLRQSGPWGARRLLNAPAAAPFLVQPPTVLEDVDTPQAYARLSGHRLPDADDAGPDG